MTNAKHRVGTKRYQFKPFEDEAHLECICRLALRGRDVGAYLLRNGHKFSFVFGFQTPGIHTLLMSGQAEVALARLEEGLKGFRPGDRLRIHLRSFGEDGDRQQELDHLVNHTSSLESQFLLLSQQRSFPAIWGRRKCGSSPNPGARGCTTAIAGMSSSRKCP
jgi:hypothetical protein